MEPENFSEPEAQAAPAPPSVSEAVAMSAEELAANPEEARRRFEATVAGLREAFARLVTAKEEQFQQVRELGRSGDHENAAAFLKHLEQEIERLQFATAQTDRDIEDTSAIMEQEEEFEERERMKSAWQKLHADGVPKDQWPLSGTLTWADQFQAQAEVDRIRKNSGESAALNEAAE